MTNRALLYARYSTDKQRETSIDDQLREARARAEREGWAVVAMHADEGVSGSTPVALRRGGKALLADALAGRFDILVVEGLDRLSRELGEAEQLVKRLEHRGIRIIGTSDGYDTAAKGRKVMRIARGLVNELYLDDLREKTHRGLAGQFDRGLSAGGRSYGYGTVEDGRGRRMVVDEAEAVVVREVFESHAAGDSVSTIVHRLNARGVPSPRGGTWSVGAVHGSSTRGLGLLHNELYRGRVLWNRRQWLKDPDTGKRRYVERPQSEWLERDAPELRIISNELWDAAHARRRSGVFGAAPGTRPARTLFGGLLRCGTCSGPMIAVNSTRYGCNVHKDRGPSVCANGETLAREVVDRRLMTEVREELERPFRVAELRKLAREAFADHVREACAAAGGIRRRLSVLDEEIGRIVDAIAAVGLSPALTQRLRAAEADRVKLQADVAAAEPMDVDALVDEVAADYRALMLRLGDALRGDDLERTRAALADFLGAVTVTRDEVGVWAEMQRPADHLSIQAISGSSIDLVAGACNLRKRLRLC